MSIADVVELHQLAYRYAAAVDACDVEGFLDVFHPDARLRVYQPDAEEPFSDAQGAEALAEVPRMMGQMFRRTAHQMTNPLVEVNGDTATGTVLCAARHLSKDDDDDTSLVVIIRYVDRYERRDREWRILDREIRFLWSERHPLADAAFG